jgi:2-keto-4-pentenoate hydratase/2-oxohepta-3-ene-1,7-dioic acid hydratase in catechol pathway
MYRRDTEERMGILIDQTVYDCQACASYLDVEPVPSTLLQVLSAGMTGPLMNLNKSIREAREAKTDLPLQCWAAVTEVKTCAPIDRPPKLICLGRNYREHAEEQGAEVPGAPMLFCKASTSVIGHEQPIVIPKGSTQVDFEGELAFVIGKRITKADESQAAESIFGYCCMNDVTERQAQFTEKQWFRAKSMDTFAPLGPCIVTSDEIGDPLALNITTKVNSQVMQLDTTSNLIFTPEQIVVFITRTITLEPGDIVSTGTPAGVGVFRDPQVFLKSGDRVEISIEGIGSLSNPVVEEI